MLDALVERIVDAGQAEFSAGGTAIRPVVLTKVRPTRIATVQTAGTTTKATVTRTDLEAASQPIDGQLLDQESRSRKRPVFVFPGRSSATE